jgi:hypothetical protein
MGVSRAISRAPFVYVPPASQVLGGEREREIAQRAGELAGRRPLLKDEVCPTISGSRPAGPAVTGETRSCRRCRGQVAVEDSDAAALLPAGVRVGRRARSRSVMPCCGSRAA